MIGFATPGFLALLAPVLGLLTYAYIFKGSGTKKIISSTMLVRELAKRVSSRQKIKLPKRFFAEALIFILLVSLIAGLHFTSKAKSVGIVLDNSQSTGAVSGSQKVIFDSLKEKASEYLEDLPAGSTVFFRPTESVGWVSEGRTVEQAMTLVDELGVTMTRDDISSAFEGLSSIELDEVVIFTDRKLESIAPDRVKVVNADTPPSFQNVAISKVGIVNDSSELSVEIGSSAARDTEVELELQELTIDGKVVSRISHDKVMVSSRGVIRALLPITRQTSKFLKVSLRFEPGFVDALLSDNEWFIYLGANNAKKIKVISDLTAADLKIKGIQGYNVDKINPKEYLESNTKEWDVSVFHKWVPEVEVKESSVYIAPTSSNQDVDIRAPNLSSKLTRWDESSPLLSYLNLSLLNFPTLAVVSPKDYQRPLMFCEDGSIAVAGQIKDRRVAVFGFELFPFEGKNSAAMSILTLNLLKWITSTVPTSSGMHPENNIASLDGRIYLSGYGIPRGIYRERDVANSVWFHANFFEQGESLERTPFSLSTNSRWASKIPDVNAGSSKLILYLVLLITILDLLFTLFSKTVAGLK